MCVDLCRSSQTVTLRKATPSALQTMGDRACDSHIMDSWSGKAAQQW